jgi:hypothetical protein
MKLKKISKFILVAVFFIATIFILESCSSKNVSAAKPGAVLWGENCVRCHNAPSPAAFSDEQWETITLHMRVRASLTANETEKVVDFLKMAN